MSWTILAGQCITVLPLLRETLKELRVLTVMGEDEKPIGKQASGHVRRARLIGSDPYFLPDFTIFLLIFVNIVNIFNRFNKLNTLETILSSLL